MRGVLIPAKRLRSGDVLLNGHESVVERTMGKQGRKPRDGRAPLMRVVLDDSIIDLREDEAVRVKR